MNYTSYSVNLFPINYQKLTTTEIETICQRVRETTVLNGPCLYKWNDEENCLNVLYVAKRMASCFYQDKILDKFHYWQISGDEGYANDTILGQSRLYKGTSLGELNHSNIEKNDYWEYASTCFYQANKIRITGFNNSFSDLIEDIFSREYEQKVKIENHQFERRLKMIYLSCNDRMSIENLGYETYEFNFKSELFNDGGLNRFISNKSYGRDRNDDFLKRLIIQSNTQIKSIELFFKERIVHKILWDSSLKSWKRFSADFWDNCIDSEYIIFSEWYKQKKAAANNA